jgi:biotin synthase
MLEILSEFNPPPESIPVNSLMPVPGTPLEGAKPTDSFDLVRMIALARIAAPSSKVRLSAGRSRMSDEMQALCFFAGANSIFYGDRLLTTDNPSAAKDRNLLERLGLTALEPNPALVAPRPDDKRPRSPHPCVAGP